MSSRCVRSSCVMRLKVSPRWARSPSDWRTGTRTNRLPVDTRLAAPIRRRIGATRRLAKFEPDPHRRQQHDQRDHRVHQREGDLHADAALLDRGIFLHARARRLQLRHHARIEQPRHVEKLVVVLRQPDDRRDIIGVGQQHDLRLLVGDAAPAPRAAAAQTFRLVRTSARATTLRSLSSTIAAASPRTEAWKVRNCGSLVAILVEDRLVARNVDRP